MSTHTIKASTRRKTRIILLAILVAAVGLYFVKRHYDAANAASANLPAITGDADDLISFSVVPGQGVSGIVEATGSVQGNYFFEAAARGMLLDADKKAVANFPLKATSNWLTADAVTFSATIDTTDAVSGPGYIRLENDNPSGDPEKDKFIDIPVTFE